MPTWYLISPSPWSIALYAIWAWWASKKIPSDMYIRIHRLAAWVDCVWVAGVVVLVGDILWVIADWIRWIPTHPEDTMLLVNSQIRNISLLTICLIMSRDLWKTKIIQWRADVYALWGVVLLYLALWFGLAPGVEWTHWVYAIENGYACWPTVWGISFIIGRAITTLIFWRTWNVEPDR